MFWRTKLKNKILILPVQFITEESSDLHNQVNFEDLGIKRPPIETEVDILYVKADAIESAGRTYKNQSFILLRNGIIYTVLMPIEELHKLLVSVGYKIYIGI